MSGQPKLTAGGQFFSALGASVLAYNDQISHLVGSSMPNLLNTLTENPFLGGHLRWQTPKKLSSFLSAPLIMFLFFLYRRDTKSIADDGVKDKTERESALSDKTTLTSGEVQDEKRELSVTKAGRSSRLQQGGGGNEQRRTAPASRLRTPLPLRPLLGTQGTLCLPQLPLPSELQPLPPLLEEKLTVTGLGNPGNICFLNSTLQALASLPPFVAYVVALDEFRSSSATVHPVEILGVVRAASMKPAAPPPPSMSSVSAELRTLLLRLECPCDKWRRERSSRNLSAAKRGSGGAANAATLTRLLFLHDQETTAMMGEKRRRQQDKRGECFAGAAARGKLKLVQRQRRHRRQATSEQQLHRDDGRPSTTSRKSKEARRHGKGWWSRAFGSGFFVDDDDDDDDNNDDAHTRKKKSSGGFLSLWSGDGAMGGSSSGSGGGGLFSSRPGGLQAQQDAEELLQALAAALEVSAEERAAAVATTTTTFFSRQRQGLAVFPGLLVPSPSQLGERGVPPLLSPPPPPLPSPLRGSLATRIVCHGPCSETMTTPLPQQQQQQQINHRRQAPPLPRFRRTLESAPFLDVSLCLGELTARGAGGGSQAQPVRLEALIFKFTSCERIQGVECEACSAMARREELATRVGFLEDAVRRARGRKEEEGEEAGDKDKGVGDKGVGDEDDDEIDLLKELARTKRGLRKLTCSRPDSSLGRKSAGGNETGDFADGNELEDIDDDDDEDNDEEEELTERHPIDKYVLFSRLPECLVFHIGRQSFDAKSGQMAKLRRRVVFPIGGLSVGSGGVPLVDEPLDMAPFVAFGGGKWRQAAAAAGANANASDWRTKAETAASATVGGGARGEGGGGGGGGGGCLLYDLNAVVVHHGNGNGTNGHYTCYRRLQEEDAEVAAPSSDTDAECSRDERLRRSEGSARHLKNTNGDVTKKKTKRPEPRWVHVSDARSEEVDASEVAACEAYLLFYCRRNHPSG